MIEKMQLEFLDSMIGEEGNYILDVLGDFPKEIDIYVYNGTPDTFDIESDEPYFLMEKGRFSWEKNILSIVNDTGQKEKLELKEYKTLEGNLKKLEGNSIEENIIKYRVNSKQCWDWIHIKNRQAVIGRAVRLMYLYKAVTEEKNEFATSLKKLKKYFSYTNTKQIIEALKFIHKLCFNEKMDYTYGGEFFTTKKVPALNHYFDKLGSSVNPEAFKKTIRETIHNKILREMPDCLYEDQFYTFRPLHIAAFLGSKEWVEKIMEEGNSNINAFDFEYKTPLELALIGGHFDIADILIQRGAKAWWNNDTNHHLLYSLCNNNRSDAITFLLEHHQEARDNVDKPALGTDRTPLLECCLSNNLEAVKLLVKYGANLDRKFLGRSLYEMVSELAKKYEDRKELVEYLSLAMKKEPKNFDSQNNFIN